MTKETAEQINKMIDAMPINEYNQELTQEIKQAISIGDDSRVLALMNELQKNRTSTPKIKNEDSNKEEQYDESDDENNDEMAKKTSQIKNI